MSQSRRDKTWKMIRITRSVCPVCRCNLPAALWQDPEFGEVELERTCEEHGTFSVPVWRGKTDFTDWTNGADSLLSEDGETLAGAHCPEHCGLCEEHEQGTCCMLLEVTARCNLHCSFCFARGGEDGPAGRVHADPSTEELEAAIRDIALRCGGPTLQLSGGEPTLREDLPELIALAKKDGCAYVQLNSNGIRLAQEEGYAARLAGEGLDFVFLQFDGLSDTIYRTLRGEALLEQKRKAILQCSRAGLGVTLVPTVVPGINDHIVGDLVRFAAENIPAVRGIHFQPVTYFGRTPCRPIDAERYTLDQLMEDLCRQTGIPKDSFVPSRCDHPLCEFHSSLVRLADGSLSPVSHFDGTSLCRTTPEKNREYIGSRWSRPASPSSGTTGNDTAAKGTEAETHQTGMAGSPPNIVMPHRTLHFQQNTGMMDLDEFVDRMRHSSLVLSAMAFQDAGNLNIERLHRCSLHVYNHGQIVPFCAHYLDGSG